MTFFKTSKYELNNLLSKKYLIISLLICSQIFNSHSIANASPIINDNNYQIVPSQPQRILAVADFTNDTGDPSMDYLKKGLANSLVTSLGLNSTTSFSIVERGQFESLIKEMGLANSGVVDVSTATKIGNALGATEVIVGGIIKLGNTLRLNIRVIDVKTSRLQFAYTEYTNSEGDVLKLLDKIAYQIVSTLHPTVPQEITIPEIKPEVVVNNSDKLKIDTTVKKEEEGIPTWMWIAGGLIIVGGLIIFVNTALTPKALYPDPITLDPVYLQNNNSLNLGLKF